MKVIGKAGRDDIAIVYVAEIRDGHYLEFVESLQPPHSREAKWVLIVSTLLGCPIGCLMCDAGGWYKGKLSKDEVLEQADYMITSRFPDRKIPVRKFKIQFSRLGEPALNPEVLEVLRELPRRYEAPGLLPSLSTIAPCGTESFFSQLKEIKDDLYSNGRFQLQFSVHSTDPRRRDEIIPAKKWGLAEIAAYGEKFFAPGDKKISLNFALAQDSLLEVNTLTTYFDPARYLVKLTPVNPTVQSANNNIQGVIKPGASPENEILAESLRQAGYQVILSIGEIEENKIGSNCGQYIRRHIEALPQKQDAYRYCIDPTDGLSLEESPYGKHSRPK